VARPALTRAVSFNSSHREEQTRDAGIIALNCVRKVAPMGLVFLILIGGMLGWQAAIIARAEAGPARLRNILTGIAGALIAGLVVNPLLGGGDLLEGQYSVEALLIALLGSVVVLVAGNLWPDREFR
jgi:uncharacterized membrane protein YeaQ/YmgE (transglycosylase-associated protein family)